SFTSEKRKSCGLPFQERNRKTILERTIKEIDFASKERKTRIKRHIMCINIAQVPGLRGASQVVLVVKNPPTNVGDRRDQGLIAESRRSLGGEHDNPL
ncbi:hypothetical protein, partial [Flavonifractor plautii]|uniref:hypothetical protein n=1 Tax=Flavonifractor plautii TaxID=292800 RepID=UPI003D7DD404